MTANSADLSGRTPGGRPILVIDTATTRAIIGLADAAGRIVAADGWSAGYRHGEELLARIDALLAVAGVRLADLGAIVIGLGPGAFTGLRVGLATAKGLAHGLAIPIVGLSTGATLLAALDDDPASPEPRALLLPAGPSDQVVVDPDRRARLVPGGVDPDLDPGWTLAALDLAGRAPDEALARGERARDGLAAALARIGAERLARGDASDLATLVPEYVTLPRGVREEVGAVAWSHDRP